jgi:choice-of-anchor B domain-containing protein
MSMNMNELGFYDPVGYSYNDIWGYVDGNSNEYAIMGSWQDDIFIIDVTTPSSPTVSAHFFHNSVSGLSMQNSLWRDFKTYNGYLYAVADQGNMGLMIFNLNTLPSSVQFETQITSGFNRAHNIFIDTNSGYLYVVGTNTRNNGMIVYDLSGGNETTPVLLASVSLPGGYVHDVYVRNDTAYCSHGWNGYYLYDFSTPASPVALGSIGTTGYNHSSWLNPAGDYAIVAEEVPTGLPLIFMDVANPSNMNMDTTFQYPLEGPGTFNTPHNPFIKDSLCYVSYYNDGVQIFDISNPPSVQIVGYYDTYPDNNNGYTGYDGCWGVYPYLPSGNIIASDTKYGLRVLEYAPAPLPVELIRFQAEKDDEKVSISWETALEERLESFELQRSFDGMTFETIQSFQPRNLRSGAEYQYHDLNALPGTNYYRLRINEIEKHTFSAIEIVSLPVREAVLIPTIAEPGQQIQLALAQAGQLTLLDTNGQVYWSGKLSFTDQLTRLDFDTSTLPSGLYFLQIDYGPSIETRKILIR